MSARNEKAPESSENKTYGMKTMDILKRLQFDRHIFCKSHNPGRSSYVDKQSVIGQTGISIGYMLLNEAITLCCDDEWHILR